MSRIEKKKLEEELMELNKELEELGSESVEAAILRLQEEVKNCKNILKCGVCFDRPKEVIILIIILYLIVKAHSHHCHNHSPIFDIMHHQESFFSAYQQSFFSQTIFAGGNCEMLSSLLQAMHPTKLRDPTPEMSRLRHRLWPERCPGCQNVTHTWC